MSNRILKVNSLIKRELSEIFLKEFEFSKNLLVTITRVETTKDLREGNVFVSVIPEGNLKKTVDFLNRKVYLIQRKINERLKMKFVPGLRFLPEKRTIEAAKIEEVLEKLKKEKK